MIYSTDDPHHEDLKSIQKPYRYGIILMCLGTLINWLVVSDADPNAGTVRYVGVAFILTGAVLVCMAMCCWVRFRSRQQEQTLSTSQQSADSSIMQIVTISDQVALEKPPSYEQVTATDNPPSYQEIFSNSTNSSDTVNSSPSSDNNNKMSVFSVVAYYR